MAGIVDQDREGRAVAAIDADYAYGWVDGEGGGDFGLIAPEHLHLAVGFEVAAVEAQVCLAPAVAHLHGDHRVSGGADGAFDAWDGVLDGLGIFGISGAG